MKKIILPVSIALFLLSCQKENQRTVTQDSSATSESVMTEEDINSPDEVDISSTERFAQGGGHIYTESNDIEVNNILVYKQSNDGVLKLWKKISSGGKGTGAGLGSQGAICINKDRKWLFAVNAGSNSFSVFDLHEDGNLTLKTTIGTLGQKPTSITSYGDVVYVLNNGSSTISGFTYKGNAFVKSPGAPHNLSGSDVDAPQVMFQPDGKCVVVTEKKTNIINVFKLNSSGGIIDVTQLI